MTQANTDPISGSATSKQTDAQGTKLKKGGHSWKIDLDHSSLQFTVKHLVVANVRGQFRRWTADLRIDESDLTQSSVSVEVDVSSVDTGNAQRDADLHQPNFFDAEKYPVLTFRSRRIERVANDRLNVFGDLTIRGVTREVVLGLKLAGFITDPWGGRRTGLSATATVNRSDFGMVWNQVLDGGGLFIGEQVNIQIEIEAVAQAPLQASA